MASSALPGIYIIISWNTVNVEMLQKTRADDHGTSLLCDLSLSVLLYDRNGSISDKENDKWQETDSNYNCNKTENNNRSRNRNSNLYHNNHNN